MTFYGKENEPAKVAPGPLPLRKYAYKSRSNQTPDTVEAHFLTFTANHINFWKQRSDDRQDTLVLSKDSSSIYEITEVTS